MIKAVIFDLDDTLYPESSFQESGFNFISQYLTGKGYSVSVETLHDLYTKNPKTLFDVLVERYQLPISAQELVVLYREHAPRIALYAGVKEVLEDLQKKYTLGMITDHLAQQQKNKVLALNIAPSFQHILYSDELDTMKPNVLLFEKMKELTGAKEGEIVYVADNEKKDFIGARAAGYVTIKFKSGGVYADVDMPPEYKADFEITSHDEVLPILEKLSHRQDSSLSN